MLFKMSKKVTPIALSLSLLATTAYAYTSTAHLSRTDTSAVSSEQVSINGSLRVSGVNQGSYRMDAQAVQNLFGPDITRASFTVSPNSSIRRVTTVPASTYYAKAKPTYINYKDGTGWTIGSASIRNN